MKKLGPGDDLEMIRSPSHWPCWPRLPLVRSDVLYDEHICFVVDDGKMLTVYLTLIYYRVTDTTQKLEYKTHQELFEDGWRVD